MGNGASAARSTAAAATADVAASAVLTSDDAYLDLEEVVTKVRACDKDGNGKIDRRELQGLLASICVQGVEAAAEKEDIISQAVGGVVDMSTGEPRTWMHPDHPIGHLWGIFGAALLMVKMGKVKPVIETKGEGPSDKFNEAGRSAEEVVDACLRCFDTIVLLSVKAGNWRSCWVRSLITTLLLNIPRCRLFTMFAVRGGAACDCEIQFIEKFMELLGAKVVQKAADCGMFLLWGWKVKRDGADDCLVRLQQFKTVEDASVVNLKAGFQPDKYFMHAPNLSRSAVVSAPEKDIAGEPIAARLNKNVGDALANAKEWARVFGFKVYT